MSTVNIIVETKLYKSLVKRTRIYIRKYKLCKNYKYLAYTRTIRHAICMFTIKAHT